MLRLSAWHIFQITFSSQVFKFSVILLMFKRQNFVYEAKPIQKACPFIENQTSHQHL